MWKMRRGEPESFYAWVRVGAALAIMTVGSVGMYVMSIALEPVRAEFGTDRGIASLAYTVTMLGFGLGGILMGRLSDRFGIFVPLLIGGVSLGLGFTAAGMARELGWFIAAHGILIGMFGCSATFAPLVADAAMWFNRRRGIAVAITASGNYLAGAVWAPILQHYFETSGWRDTYVGVGAFCAAVIVGLSFVFRIRPPLPESGSAGSRRQWSDLPLGLTPNALMILLSVAGVACCVAMAMPQVHIVAYCGDLGYGAARGAEMLSVMLGAGIVSRLVSGLISDRIGGLRTLLLGSALQGIALTLFLPFNGLVSLYIVSAMFGLFQGGIVPAYALVVREYFDPRTSGVRTGIVLMATMVGMALGGWMSGWIFDLTGSYRAAFVNGIVFNLLNLAVAFWLLRRASRLGALLPA